MATTWGDVLKELKATKPQGEASPFDLVRRKYLKKLSDYTGRSTIIYATAGFNLRQGVSPSEVSITLDPDVEAFMEVVHGLPTDVPLDLILHSPGGSAEAAEAIVSYLRGRFPGLRVIVPVAAMSAATMIAMAADEIVMAAHSQLGPIDPQMILQTPEGPRSSPAEAILQQFEDAKADLAQHPEHTAAWLPILRSFAPALLKQCQSHIALSKTMVTKWLAQYMFNGADDPQASAERVADYLTNWEQFKSHSRRIDRDDLRALDLNIVDLEADQELQDRVLSVHHSVNHLIDATPVVKLVENHNGKAFVRSVGAQIQLQAQPAPPNPQLPQQLPGNRQQRRKAEAEARKGNK